MAKVICCVNQKGGVGKTTSCVNLGIGLAKRGYKVLIVDCDAQGSLTVSLGYQQPDKIETTLATILEKILSDGDILPQEGILHHDEGGVSNAFQKTRNIWI